MDTTHQHLFHEEADTWLDPDGFLVCVGGDDFWGPSANPYSLLTASHYHYEVTWMQ